MKHHIAIFGAGPSGLAAAAELIDAGYQVTIYEARDRVGGRVDTVISRSGHSLERGANWIHGTGTDGQGNPNPLLALAESAQVSNQPDTSNITLLDRANRPLSLFTRLRILADITRAGGLADNKGFDRAMTRRIQAGEASFSQADLLNEVVASPPQANPDQNDPRTYFGSSTLLQFYQTAMYGGQRLDHVSGLPPRQKNYKHGAGEDHIVTGGYQNLFKIILAKLSKSPNFRIVFDAEVVAIDYTKGSFGIKNRLTGEIATHQADRLIATFPIGVLQKAILTPTFFNPPLPPEKSHALINTMTPGLMNKVFITFSSNFWSGPNCPLQTLLPAQFIFAMPLLPDDPKNTRDWTPVIDYSVLTPGENTLVFIQYGEKARFTGTDEEIAKPYLAWLKTCFGSRYSAPTDIQVTRWHEDPLTLGSWPVNGEMATVETREDAAKPVGRLYFAGDATGADMVHQAMESGLVASHNVLASIDPLYQLKEKLINHYKDYILLSHDNEINLKPTWTTWFFRHTGLTHQKALLVKDLIKDIRLAEDEGALKKLMQKVKIENKAMEEGKTVSFLGFFGLTHSRLDRTIESSHALFEKAPGLG